MNEVLIPALCFGTILAVLWFGVMGIKGVKKDKREGTTSALATRDDEADTKMLVPSAATDDRSAQQPIGSGPDGDARDGDARDGDPRRDDARRDDARTWADEGRAAPAETASRSA